MKSPSKSSFPWLPFSMAAAAAAAAIAAPGSGGMKIGIASAFDAVRRPSSSTVVVGGVGRVLFVPSSNPSSSSSSSRRMVGSAAAAGTSSNDVDDRTGDGRGTAEEAMGGGRRTGGGRGRRAFLHSRAGPAVAAIVSPLLLLPPLSLWSSSTPPSRAASVPVQRAVGSAESKCKVEGNCLEKLDIDGAVGWNWGGIDRCDASDPNCGPDGTPRTDVPSYPVPSLPAGGGGGNDVVVTDVVEMTLTIGSGSRSEMRKMRMGLYGAKNPASVREMIDLCGRTGLITSKDLLLGSPVRLGGGGGSLTYIRHGERVFFGVPSQRVAYARYTRRAKAPDEYVPQSRPDGIRLREVRDEVSSRMHDVAGLVSVPREGIGYGGGLALGKDDEAYADSFQLTIGTSARDMDDEGRKVIGQLLDSESMDTLSRLAGLATRKLLPGQGGGTPLIKVTVDDCVVYSMAEWASKGSK